MPIVALPEPVGILLTNLGTPDSPRPADVRRYLKEFLLDPHVVEMSRPLWYLILFLFVLPTRPRKTARAYKKIWSEHGSPLLAISLQQQQKLQLYLEEKMGTGIFRVALGMRYGQPSIASALAELRSAGVHKLLVLPLYPQYSATTTASTFEAVCTQLSTWRHIPAMRMIDQYHDHHGYIDALANSVREYRHTHGSSEQLLISFHGIPQAYADAGDPYPDQCRQTAQHLAEALSLGAQSWQLSFQSRLGRKPWLQPYTDHTLTRLARAGINDVQVVCPGFSADCLETLEEVAMENCEVFKRAGGKRYGYIPCLNTRDDHISVLADLIIDHTQGWYAN